MNFLFAFTDSFQHIGGEIVVFQIVEAAFNHLTQIECFGTARLRGNEIEALLGY